MREELLEFEKKLLELRLEMNELLKRVDSENSVENMAKLRQLEAELGYVIRQYRSLEGKVNEKERPAVQPVQPMQPLTKPNPEIQNVQPTMPVAPKKNMENAIGTSLMGVLASGLIFISIILFATLGLPYLSDVFKMLACYVISIVVIAVSMYKLEKHPGNKFFLSLSGCGVGALYISILLTNIYFEYIDDITLFIFITVWVFFMCALSKIKSKLFAIIAHVGIMISVMFGTLLCMSESDMLKMLMLTIFFAVSTGTLYVIHFDKQLIKNILVNIFSMIDLFVLAGGAGFIIDTYFSGYFIFLGIIILAFLGVAMYCDWNDSNIAYGVVPLVYVVILLLSAGEFFETSEAVNIFAYVVSIIMLFAVEIKRSYYEILDNVGNVGKYLLQIFMIIFAWEAVAAQDASLEVLVIPMLALPLFVLGVWKENSLCKYAGMFMVFIFITGNVDIYVKFVVALVVLIGLYVVSYVKYETTAYKVCLHLLSIVFALKCISGMIGEMATDYQTEGVLTYIIITVFNMIMFRVSYVRDESTTVYNIVNAIAMAMGLSIIGSRTDWHILVILVVIAAFMVNSKRFLDNGRFEAGIYVGVKFTILLLVIMASFDTENYIVSILLILAAIVSIVIGFAFGYKALRIYGLVLSMISIVKLVMVDIHYENTLGNALSFFVSGVLCFAISMIYNYIGKKIDDNVE